jgi:hypothetical protein
MRTVVSRECGYARNPSESQFPSLWRGLVSWWLPSIHARGGAMLLDLVGRNNGTLRDMANDDWIIDAGQGSLSFDGVNDTVIAAVNGMTNLTKGTVSFWIKTATEAKLAIAIQQSGGSSNSMWFGVGQNLTGAFTDELITTVRSISGSITHQAAYTTATRTELFDNKWHHVAFVFDGEYRIYLDGNLKTVTVSGPNDGTFFSGIPSLNSFSIGARDWSASRLVVNGCMDDIRVYSRPLVNSELFLLSSRRGIGSELAPKKKKKPQAQSLTNRRRRILTGMV